MGRRPTASDLFRPDSITLGVTNDNPSISGDKARRCDLCLPVRPL